MQLNRQVACLLAGLLCLVVAGCGGGSKSGPKPAAGLQQPPLAPGQQQPNPAAGPANGAPAKGQAGPAEVAATGKTTPADDASNDPAVDEELKPSPDEFEIDQTEMVLEIAGQYTEPPLPVADVEALPNGRNSTNLDFVDPNANENASTLPGPRTPMGGAPVFPPTPSNPGTTTANQTDQSSWKLPERATAVAAYGVEPETGLPRRIITDQDPVEMVLIPPGVFLEGVDGRDPNAEPQHSVLLETPYYIDVVELTVARHNVFREFYRKSEGRKIDPSVHHDGNPDLPATGIKFLDAKFYAKWAGKELPTEAQWERAARGGEGFDYPWGNGRPIWHQARSPGQLDPVASYPGDRSPFGVWDMAGNAREWCLDLYSPDGFQKQIAAGGSPIRNPTGPKTFQGAKLQVVKGGKTDWAVWQRAGVAQTETPPDLGFRCVLNISDADTDTEKPATSKPAAKSADKPAATKGSDKKKKNTGL